MKLVNPGPEPARLDASFWTSVSGVAEPTTRQKFVYLTIHEFARLGPGRFSHAKIARRLGVTVAMVNHYFGSRNGLISECAFTVYSEYIEAMAAAVREAPRNPEARLRAWIETQISFAVSVPGWAMILNYPQVALEDPIEFETEFRQAMTTKFSVNIARLAQLVLDIAEGSVSTIDIDESNVDLDAYLTDPKLVALSSTISFATLGAAVWAAGTHAPSSDIASRGDLGDMVLTEHVNQLVRLAESFGQR